MKKILVLTLSLVMLCLAFASCTDVEVTQAVGGEGSKETVLSGDFGGEQFRILTAGQTNGGACNDFGFEQENTDATYLEQAQYERILTVEQAFNVDIIQDTKRVIPLHPEVSPVRVTTLSTLTLLPVPICMTSVLSQVMMYPSLQLRASFIIWV